VSARVEKKAEKEKKTHRHRKILLFQGIIFWANFFVGVGFEGPKEVFLVGFS
jgi:hypothetical protein